MPGPLQELFTEHRLTPAQRRIAAYLLANVDTAAYLTSVELAEAAAVSQPSVTRFVALLGFDGYGHFRRYLRQAGSEPAADQDARGSKLQSGIDEDMRNLARLRTELADDSALRTAGTVLASSNPLVVLGFRVSAPLASLFGYLAAKIHPDVRLLISGGSIVGDQLRHARQCGADATIVFAMPRYPRETQRAMVQARDLGLRTVLVTDRTVSALTPDADDVLAAAVGEELVFDSHAAVMSLSTSLLEAMADAAGASARRRLENFEQYAADQELFLDD
ncbi:RpiR family transcriptional regulator [Saccharopolyspora erythraea NRRL 2338]|uniref:Transcriptional regulator, RpiR family n=2 Tax=Saccharopolyspora erythraea TaxID=1836 RepID=A4FJ87_SACEN|nr:MurR/RpiR family transcriptional regulator [Saccharopolyspora erythraea]EQD82936.1 RpiR family transcriptional regulator [Saccharopolyspora erythraea D]PFG97783.1 RpiR family transcriptional regulator [Saccharopolyspora erythraea NRRL 2338]QRK87926.1 MurR/RpiR family transcriptional regulator [Saccharopolyspora erythraea]CAM04112.1 transcriptional regulator, RpiR family [Saccharopolyspora erythraea NRRL 2338]